MDAIVYAYKYIDRAAPVSSFFEQVVEFEPGSLATKNRGLPAAAKNLKIILRDSCVYLDGREVLEALGQTRVCTMEDFRLEPDAVVRAPHKQPVEKKKRPLKKERSLKTRVGETVGGKREANGGARHEKKSTQSGKYSEPKPLVRLVLSA